MNRIRFQKSLRYAARGLSRIFREEQNFRIQVFVAFFVFILALFAKISGLQMLLLLGTICFVFILECINTVVEAMTDLLKPRISEQVKYIKDIMAGAVLLASIFAVSVGIFLFLPLIKSILEILFESLLIS
jgi:diacylglycerol kinase